MGDIFGVPTLTFSFRKLIFRFMGYRAPRENVKEFFRSCLGKSLILVSLLNSKYLSVVICFVKNDDLKISTWRKYQSI